MKDGRRTEFHVCGKVEVVYCHQKWDSEGIVAPSVLFCSAPWVLTVRKGRRMEMLDSKCLKEL